MAHQLSFLPQKNKIVNVASVPLRSPFRYPGGKTWLIPRIRQWLGSLSATPDIFIEPFTGGGIVGLTVGFENLAKHILLIELDHEVAAVWKTIINGDGPWLAERIENFNLTPETVDMIYEANSLDIREQAFQTIIKNRVNHGGILAPGAGKIKYGENGKGIESRWYPVTLSKRIRKINAIRDRFSFIEGDGLEIIRKNLQNPNAVFFIDPPYTSGGKKAGSRLYAHSEIDHNELFRLCAQVKGDFLMTYSNDEVTRQLAHDHDFTMQEIAMKNTHHAKMTELLIGRDLDWNIS